MQIISQPGARLLADGLVHATGPQDEWNKWTKQCDRDNRPQLSVAEVQAVYARLKQATTCGPAPAPPATLLSSQLRHGMPVPAVLQQRVLSC